VSNWNKQNKPSAYGNQSWSLLLDKSAYLYGDEDDKPGEIDQAGFGTTFPHPYGKSDGKYFSNFLTFSPAGDELTLDFAKAAMDAEELGKDEITDFLAISFSTTDYVGHIFGPSSLEAEDNMLRLDRTLADLFSYVDKRVGLENTLIVLSADHGGPETPEQWQKFGIDSGYVSPDKWDKEPSIAALKKRFGIGEKLFESFFPPYLYLNKKLIKESGLDLAEVEQAVAEELMGIKGVALAVTSSALLQNQLPDTFLNRVALRNFNSKRSGNILILFQPHHFINDFHGEKMAANHGGPWDYDTFVPVIFAGGHLKGQNITRRIEPIDIAPTLSAVLSIKAGSGNSGQVLKEIIK
jgi:predicted AlkP superfamily pyrophosphatase or phosphodiesterase